MESPTLLIYFRQAISSQCLFELHQIFGGLVDAFKCTVTHWHWDPTGVFSSSSAYFMLVHGGLLENLGRRLFGSLMQLLNHRFLLDMFCMSNSTSKMFRRKHVTIDDISYINYGEAAEKTSLNLFFAFLYAFSGWWLIHLCFFFFLD